MKKYKILFGLLFISSVFYGQDTTYDKLTISKRNPLVVVNGDIIGSFEALKHLDKKDIQSIHIYKKADPKTKELAKVFKNLDEYGFASVTVEQNVNAVTFNEVLSLLDIKKDTPVFLDGYKLPSLNLKINPGSISKIEKLNHDSSNLDLKEFVNITTSDNTSASFRIHHNKSDKLDKLK